jgi:hypothetical protein
MDVRRLLWAGVLWIATAAMLAGLALAFLAWQYASSRIALAALLVLLAAPPLAATAAILRTARCLDERTPVEALIAAVDAADTGVRVIRLVRAHAWVVCSYCVVLWICQAGELIDAPEFLPWFTLAVVIALAAYLPSLARLERRALERRDTGRQLLREARTAEGWFVR